MAATDPGPDQGVYGISVAAELVGMGVQTLRLYETRGLLNPARSQGGTRRYSASDLDRLRRIAELLADGLNIAGIAMVLDLEHRNAQLLEERERQQWLSTARLRTPATSTLFPDPSAGRGPLA
ncbi:MerR family transcriptional regulator [Smaragdicoccus niigatensis]|uniref:MerR family transcriptional regulator n=1 Tax=Smaragdicoccus niigatensis TaxID=359359 RepID=UPI0003697C2E|nr:MerR family transcriptional regulator [Smaragdicoccus niigatensis]